MALTDLEKYNAGRKRMGLEPVTELPANSNGKPKEDLSDEEKAKVEAKKKEDADKKAAEQAEAEKQRKAEEDKKKQEELELAKAAALNDDSVTDYLKKKGFNVSSLEDLKKKPDPADIEKEKEEREREKMSFGFKKVFTKKEYDAYESDVKNKNELVFKASFDAAKQDDPELTEDEYRAEFNDKYGVDEEKTSRKFKEGQRILSNLANNIIQQKHSKILKLDEVYANYESQENEQKSQQMKILANAPAYTKDVENVMASLAKVKTKFAENEESEVDVTPEVLKEVKDTLLDTGFAQKKIAQGWTKDEISEVAEMLLWKKDRENIIKKSAELYHKNHAKGTHGIPPSGRGQRLEDTNVLDEKIKQAAERHGALPPTKN